MSQEATRDLGNGSVRRVQIPCGAVTLEGELAAPAGAPGVVMFAHGGRKPGNRDLAGVLCDAGLATLLFDLLTEEEDTSPKIRFDLGRLTARLVIATLWLTAQAPYGNLGIGYLASGVGAGAALAAAAQLRERIDAVVSHGGRPDLAGKDLPRVKAPTLFIVGAFDRAISRLNEQAFSELRCDKEFSTVANATHRFEEPGALDLVARLALDWFRKHLRTHSPAPGYAARDARE